MLIGGGYGAHLGGCYPTPTRSRQAGSKAYIQGSHGGTRSAPARDTQTAPSTGGTERSRPPGARFH
eukprot:7374842-Prorocentrum_lima.AAC.1